MAQAQDLIVKVGLAMDYAGVEATARAIREQAKAYRRLADRMDQAADDIFASVAQHRADVAAAEADAEEVPERKCTCGWPDGAGHDRGCDLMIVRGKVQEGAPDGA